MKKIWACLTVLAVVGLVASFVFETELRGKLKRTNLELPELDGSPDQVAERWVQISQGQNVVDVTLSCEFYLDSIVQHENLFQTADVNYGLRFEFATPGIAAFLIGDAETGQLIALNLSDGLRPGKWNRFNLHIQPGTVIAELNEVVRRINCPGMNVRYDRLLVGSGFSGERPFHGAIRNVHGKICTSTPRPGVGEWLLGGRVLLFLLAGVFRYLSPPLPGFSEVR